ncbi:MAG TPA: hypothetical protein VMT54_06335, partial [Candidatus Cybelea sp.]|nr:hypothetical protein [Candidatus Cybelea sp.]
LDRGLSLGRNWHWRVDRVLYGNQELKLLTAFHPDYEEYRAWLGIPRDGALMVIGRLEFHGNHPGWHAHVCCGDIERVSAGDVITRQTDRLPGGFNPHRRMEFDITESSALAKAFEFFRVTGHSEDAML